MAPARQSNRSGWSDSNQQSRVNLTWRSQRLEDTDSWSDPDWPRGGIRQCRFWSTSRSSHFHPSEPGSFPHHHFSRLLWHIPSFRFCKGNVHAVRWTERSSQLWASISLWQNVSYWTRWELLLHVCLLLRIRRPVQAKIEWSRHSWRQPRRWFETCRVTHTIFNRNDNLTETCSCDWPWRCCSFAGQRFLFFGWPSPEEHVRF